MTNNKLIAEFMGLQFSKGEYYRPLFNSGDWISEDELHYHTSWDWLMPVVEKIENYLSDNAGKYFVGYFDDGLISNDIEVRYQAVVEFIKEYNK